MSLLIDDYLERNPDSMVNIVHDKLGIALTGVVSDPQLIQSLSAQYGDGAKELVGKAGGFLSGRKNMFAKGVGMVLNGLHSYNTSKDTLMGTVKLYEGSGNISIPFNMTIFYDWAGNPSFKEVDLQLNMLTQPKLYLDGLLGSNLYNPKDLVNTLTSNYNVLKGKLPYVTLGSWFMAKDVYITGLSKNISTILNEEGNPIAITISFQISPYRQLTAQELNAWILG